MTYQKSYYTMYLDALALLSHKNKEYDHKLEDTSCVSVEVLNSLKEWGFIKFDKAENQLVLTRKGRNILNFYNQNAEFMQSMVTTIR